MVGLSDDEFIEKVRDWGCSCDLLNGVNCGHFDILVELRRRLSERGRDE